MAWKKEVERIKEKIERDRDAYVLKRRKQLRAEAAKEGQAAGKIIAEVCKHAEAVGEGPSVRRQGGGTRRDAGGEEPVDSGDAQGQGGVGRARRGR